MIRAEPRMSLEKFSAQKSVRRERAESRARVRGKKKLRHMDPRGDGDVRIDLNGANVGLIPIVTGGGLYDTSCRWMMRHFGNNSQKI